MNEVNLPNNKTVDLDDLTKWTKDVKVPGILWVIGLVLGVWAIETYVPSETLQTWMELVPSVLLIVAKFTNVGGENTEALVEIIRLLQGRLPTVTRGVGPEGIAYDTPQVMVSDQKLDEMKPNKATRLLLG